MIAHKLFALSAMLFALSSIPAAGVQTSSAAATVTSFYHWYFANKTDWTRLARARPYLTPSLYSALENVLHKQRSEGAEILEFDPFIGAQEQAQWYEVRSPSGNGTRLSVPVHLGFSHSNQPATINVIVVNGSGGWKIDDFAYPGNGTLRGQITTKQ